MLLDWETDVVGSSFQDKRPDSVLVVEVSHSLAFMVKSTQGC